MSKIEKGKVLGMVLLSGAQFLCSVLALRFPEYIVGNIPE